MSIGNTRWQRQLLLSALALGALAACSDDDDSDKVVDGAVEEDASDGRADSGSTEEDGGEPGLDGGAPDAETPDAAVPAKKLTEIFAAKTPLSAAQSDRFWTATFDANGKVLAAGYVTDVVDGIAPPVLDQKLAVARFNIDGTPDITFGDVDPTDGTKRTGIARINVTVATTENNSEAVKGIAVQKDGKIVVGANVETAKVEVSLPRDDGPNLTGTFPEIDVAVARLTSAGALDTTFSADDADGKDGIWLQSFAPLVATISVDAMMAKSIATYNDDVGDLRVDSQDRIVLFARGQTNATPRTDADRITVRLLKDGAVDSDFATAGRAYFSTPGTFNDNAKNGVILAGDEILATGYTRIGMPGLTKNNIVISKLSNTGTLVAGFGTAGGLVVNPFADATASAASGQVEAYGAAFQSDGSFVTTGYGRVIGTETIAQILSCRFKAAGTLDTTFGDSGCNVLDKTKDAADRNVGNDQGRNIIALPDDRLLLVGNGVVTANDAEGVVALLGKDGKLDTSFNDGGTKTYSLGLRGDAFYGLALSNDKKYVAVTGYSGAAGAATAPVALPAEAPSAEDSALVIYELKD